MFITPCKKVFRLSVESYVLAVDGMLRDGVKEVCRLSSDDSVGWNNAFYTMTGWQWLNSAFCEKRDMLRQNKRKENGEVLKFCACHAAVCYLATTRMVAQLNWYLCAASFGWSDSNILKGNQHSSETAYIALTTLHLFWYRILRCVASVPAVVTKNGHLYRGSELAISQ